MRKMARESLISAEEAVQLVEKYPRVGQVAKNIYVGRQRTSFGEGQLVNLTAVWEGAERLSGDPTVRCIVLERNPNIRGREDAVTLRIGQDLAGIVGIQTSEIVYRRGIACDGESDLTRTILGNIARELVKP